MGQDDTRFQLRRATLWPSRAKHAHSTDRFYCPRQLDDRDERRQALLDKARLGSRDALGDLLMDYKPLMRSLIKGQLSRDLAATASDDVMQDTFLKATAAFASFIGEQVAQFTRWLMKICGSVLADFARWHQRAGIHELSLGNQQLEEAGAHGYGPRQPSPDELFIALETAGRLLSALNRLPPDERQIVLWHVSDRLSFGEIAARLLYSDDVVRLAFKHALSALRKRLVQVGFA
jgi:RNA polymerase sigma factor (sigma-70 family)